ncbi:phage integrase central domain-containing protein [Klebsiella aerogenes]|uniref:phage integrase central domain-containing protein n=1 Tax=Klebsiella aerogenes TaxID=548 RepID=UPI0007B34BFF|nr:hypothetical protein A3N65_12335 [Klebsiella aerogenes]
MQNTFRIVRSKWVEFRAHKYREGCQTSQTQMQRIFHKDVIPWIGELPITDITRQDILKILRRIERRKAWSIATKCRSWLNQLFRYAMIEYDLPANPTADLDIIALTPPPPQPPLSAINWASRFFTLHRREQCSTPYPTAHQVTATYRRQNRRNAIRHA